MMLSQITDLLYAQVRQVKAAGGFVHPLLDFDVDISRVGNEVFVTGDIHRNEVSLIVPSSLKGDDEHICQIAQLLGHDWEEYKEAHLVTDACYPVASYYNHSEDREHMRVTLGEVTAYGDSCKYRQVNF